MQMKCNDFGQCIETSLKSNNDCKRFKKCVVYADTRKQAVCEENRKKYVLRNDEQSRIALFHMDGGVIDSAEKRSVIMLCARILRFAS